MEVHGCPLLGAAIVAFSLGALGHVFIVQPCCQEILMVSVDRYGRGAHLSLRSRCVSVLGNREAWQIKVMLSNPGKTAEFPTLDCALPCVTIE